MILDYAKKYYPQIFTAQEGPAGNFPPSLSDVEQKKEAAAIFQYIKERSAQLEGDVFNRMYGVKTKTGFGYRRAGYVISRDFYEGDQWMATREDGSAMDVINFCRVTVDNYVAFLTQEEPEIDIPPRDAKDDFENARVKIVEDLIKQILDDNQFYNHWVDACTNGAMIGDSMIVGPFWDEQNKRVWFSNVKRPEFIRVIWKDENYKEMEGFIYHYYMGLEAALTKYGSIFENMGLDLKAMVYNTMPADSTQRTKSQEELRVRIIEGFDEQVHLFAVQDVIIEYQKHNNGFIPLLYVPNRPHPWLPWGISDMEDLISAQIAYNEHTSDMRDILKQVAYASIFGSNLDVEEIQAGTAKIYDMGDEATVFPDPRKTDYPFLQGMAGDIRQHVNVTGAMPEAFQGGRDVQNISGRALSVIMTPINNRIRGKEKRWSIALQTLIRNTEVLLEKHVPEAKSLIQGWYKSEIFFPGTLVRDVTEELNKMIQKVQSQYTTMKNVGIASPKDEQELMKKELTDKQLMVELSKNPQLQLQVQQMVSQAIQGVNGQPGNPQAGPANSKPTLSEGQNQGGENPAPASAPGNPAATTQTPAGALNSAAANRPGGGPAVIRK